MIKKRVDDLELFFEGTNRLPEIKRWHTAENGREFCYTLLWFEKDSEGYSVKFVGDRPFKYPYQELLWGLMVYGDRLLNADFELERIINDSTR